jgi:hypothetical protein
LKKYIFKIILFFQFALTCTAQDWELKKNQEGVKVFTKSNANSPFDLLMAECEVNVGINQMLALIYDVSRHTEWVYNSVQSVLIKKNSTYDIIYYGETYAPWPVSNRDLVIHLTAFTDSITGICNITAISEPKLKPLVKGKIRIPRSVSKWKLIAINKQTTRVIYTLDIDPGGSLPSWLVNFASIEGPYLSFLKMRALLLK